ncbi:MAG TPA: aminopeptidase P family protein [Cytophagales bacterium]|nr:aminopeptidase P family protein [Cytophagales bacterium]
MRYTNIPNSLFINNRKNFSQVLKPKSIAIFNSNDIMPTNADGTMGFRQNNDLFYLSGIDQEETILLLFPDAPEEKFKEILFLKETNENIAIWEGHKLSKEEGKAISGIKTILWLSQLEMILSTLVPLCEHIYLSTNEHSRAVIEVESRDSRFIKYIGAKYPLHKYERSAPVMQHLRAIKSHEEIDLISEACRITESGFRRLLKFIKPGVMEYEIEAELSHEFLRNRSKGFAYTPIIASGFNSCVLHYIENDKVCKDGDILLLDVAAEYANYNSDLTRTIPVNGKYSKRQKEVYNAVLRVHKYAASILVPGNTWNEYQTEVGQVMEEELINLGLLDKEAIKSQNKENPLYKKYFMHGTSHHLGLDVHDVGDKYRKFEAGMVFTIEPGIYIREESLGVRIENNFVITEKGAVDLMKNIPIEAEEIEEIMSGS